MGCYFARLFILQTSEESADVPWAKDYPSWSSLVLSGLSYMAGHMAS